MRLKQIAPGPQQPGIRPAVTGKRIIGAMLACLLFGSATTQAAFEEELNLYRQGKYGEAVGRLEDSLARGQDVAGALPLLLAILIETGEYEPARDRGLRYLENQSAPEGRIEVSIQVARALIALGEYAEAEALAGPIDTPESLWLRGTLADRRGERAVADEMYSRAAGGVSEIASLGVSGQLGVVDSLIALGQYREANDLFRALTELHPANPEIKARWGRLMARKHNPGDAEALFGEALQMNPRHPGAVMGMAELAAGGWDNKAVELIEQALAVNPQLTEARLLSAGIYLEQEKYNEVAGQLDAVDRVNPNSLEAWSYRAALEYLSDNDAEADNQWIERVLAVNPGYGKVFELIGDFLVIRRQYKEAGVFYQRALDLDDRLEDARSHLGINLFRLGEEEQARRVLEAAYDRDPFNIWTVNTLRLMDSFSQFDSFETDRFRVKLHQKESKLLRPYVEEILDESLTSLTTRYKYTPPVKVIFEMYPNHEDFAVRTLGLPGLGALGASFGPVVAMDSPAARATGEFHWGSTLWHELAHVITLGITANRVPRWFTEGLSVYEEAHARPGWGDPMTLGLVQALQTHGLVPMSELNGVFVRPQYPNQVVFAYFQSGMICEFIIEQHGFGKILEMLQAYRDRKNDEEVFREVLGTGLEDFDSQFREFAREKTYGFAAAVELDMEPDLHEGMHVEMHEPEEGESGEDTPEGVEISVLPDDPSDQPSVPEDFLGKLRQAAEFREEGEFDRAMELAEEAKAQFPLYAGIGNPYELLANIYLAQDNKQAALEQLQEWFHQRGRNPETFRKLADLQAELGRKPDAIRTLEESLQVSMFSVETHETLGRWLLESEDSDKAVREFRAVLEMDPADKAQAHYRLATAHWELSDRANAREQVLTALEIAPGYRDAQKLLLQLREQ